MKNTFLKRNICNSTSSNMKKQKQDSSEKEDSENGQFRKGKMEKGHF